jgi:hypothetical protein
MTKSRPLTKTVRRSVALPRRVVEEVTAVAPGELRGNLNRLVTVALEEFTRSQKARAFEEAMARMGADPAIQAECAAIAKDFAAAEADGLREGSGDD